MKWKLKAYNDLKTKKINLSKVFIHQILELNLVLHLLLPSIILGRTFQDIGSSTAAVLIFLLLKMIGEGDTGSARSLDEEIANLVCIVAPALTWI